jgi:hypothetical protein
MSHLGRPTARVADVVGGESRHPVDTARGELLPPRGALDRPLVLDHDPDLRLDSLMPAVAPQGAKVRSVT